jgi:hypothetical protein
VSVPSAVGFIAVFGVAMLNGIVLVSFLNDLRRQGFSIREAVRRAALRLRPVLMTASVAILGLVPMLLSQGVGAETQRPLATVVVGGLFTSTALTLLLLPLMYEWLETRRERKVLEFRGTRFEARGFAIERNQNLAKLKQRYGIDRKHWDRISSGMDTDHYVYSAEPVLRAGNGASLRCSAAWRAMASPEGHCVTDEGMHINFRFE